MCTACVPAEQDTRCVDCGITFSECDLRKRTVRELNDALRRNVCRPKGMGTVVISYGVSCLSSYAQSLLLVKVSEFDAFNKDNDPRNEHDFGSIIFDGETFFWKIDYYDLSMQSFSSDPADSSVTNRVLTVMLADEC